MKPKRRKARIFSFDLAQETLDVLKRSKRVVEESCGYNDGARFQTDLLTDIEAIIEKVEAL